MTGKRLGYEWVGTNPPKVYVPDVGNDLPAQVGRINTNRVRSVDELSTNEGHVFLLGWLQGMAESGHINPDLWNKAIDVASRCERDDARRK